MMFYIQSVLGLQFLGFTVFYCYIVDPGSYLENTDNHQKKQQKGHFQRKRDTLFWGIFRKENYIFMTFSEEQFWKMDAHFS